MKKSSIFLFVFGFLLSNAQPVKQHGQLKVVGTQLTDAQNRPVVLRGVSFGWHNWWPRFYNKETVAWLATDWNCSVVRAAMGVEPNGGYKQDSAASVEKIKAVVDGAINAGIYVVIDWHSHNVNLAEAKAFFSQMARDYGKHPNVIYELFNEPDNETWPEVKAYAGEVIAAIRAVDPDNLILVGSPHWDQDVHLAADDPLTNGTNLLYTLHFYAATHKEGLRKRADYALRKGLPLFISESAGMEASGDGPLNEEEWRRWMDWAESRSVSWITWSVSDKDETCSMLKKSAASTGGWKEDELKESGQKTRASLRAYNSGGVLPAAALQPYGRTAIANGQLELISSASHFGFSFEGKECRLFASLSEGQDHNYLQFEMDGVYQKRLKVSKNKAEPLVLIAANEGRHTVWVYKATEAHTGPIFIQKAEGKNIRSLQPSAAPLIEFIGNSITCGAAADPSEVPCGQGVYHDQHNAFMAYGPRVARALNANFILSSVSGYGVYRNWNSDGPALPQVYEKTDFQNTGNRYWDFKTYTPKIVSIALGTNDMSPGDGKKQRLPFDSAGFVSNYIRFVQLVKSKYPQAQIALLGSPMINGEKRTLLQHCLTAVKAAVDRSHSSDKPLAVYFFNPMQARGCSGHPNVEDHGLMAEALVPFFKKLL